jgi:hypothetical protein
MEEWQEENLPACAFETGGIHGVEITLDHTDSEGVGFGDQ